MYWSLKINPVLNVWPIKKYFFLIWTVASNLEPGYLLNQMQYLYWSIICNPLKTVCSLCWGISNYADSKSHMVYAWVYVCPFMLWSGSWRLNYICLIMWKSRSCCIFNRISCLFLFLFVWLIVISFMVSLAIRKRSTYQVRWFRIFWTIWGP